MMKRRTFMLLLLAGLLLSVQSTLMAQSGVPAARLERLAKGVNVTRWFWLNEDTSDDHYRNYLSDEQMQAIRDAGFTHVRLPIEPKLLLDEYFPDQIDEALLGYLEAAIARFVANDLGVIVDVHAFEADFKSRLMVDTEMQNDFAIMWKTLAARLSRTNPDMVYFEVMNEPSPDDPSVWPPLQAKFAAAIREGAPEHTIIVGGADWNTIGGLLMLEPLPDTNIVYNFHFYEPFIFTHQAATWSDETVERFRGIPYPSTNGRCGELPDFGTQAANDWAYGYCNNEPWDANTIDGRMKQAADWAARYGVPLTANEFGVYPVAAPYGDRLQWLEDVRTAFERYGIGWTLWGYDDGFGLDYSDRRGMDKAVLTVLGMNS